VPYSFLLSSLPLEIECQTLHLQVSSLLCFYSSNWSSLLVSGFKCHLNAFKFQTSISSPPDCYIQLFTLNIYFLQLLWLTTTDLVA
jgi:hypothetical protein